jgi:hypothetical protein
MKPGCLARASSWQKERSLHRRPFESMCNAVLGRWFLHDRIMFSKMELK